MKYLIIIPALLLTACYQDGVTPEHTAVVNKICEQNEGTKVITTALSEPIIEGCGFKCTKATGQVEYVVEAQCKNGLKIIHKWIK